ncbi:MAG: hypothetical protein HDR27_11930 [Lachnospiraceae bacterium]|nr:hypothetical protein [Lachnospiraceae bacterium]
MMNKMEKKYWIPGIILLLWMGIFSFVNGNCQSFWADEIASVGFIRDGLSLSEIMDTYLHIENNLPLYPLILYVVYRIMPYGEKFLLIPSILFCLAGIVFLALSMRELKTRRGGLIALCMGASSGILIWQAAWEIRCYALAFMLSTLVLYAYIKKSIEPNRKHMILYSAATAFFFWTHWFAFILMAFYGVVDLLLVILKKISWKHLLSYVPGCLIYFPWLILSFYYKSWGLEDYWSEVPQWKNMAWTILFYLNGNRVLWYLCLITGAALLACAIRWLRKPYSEEKARVMLAAFCVAAIAWMIGLVFVFSRYLVPSSGLYVERYFTVVQPHILLVTAFGLEYILGFADRIRTTKIAAWAVRIAVIALLMISFGVCYRNEYVAIRKPFEPYREAADYLIEEKGIWDERSLFIGSNRFCMLDGFIHYYFEKRGYEPPANITGSMVLSEQESRFYGDYTQFSEDELLSYDRIYCLRIHMDVDDEIQQFLEEHYQTIEKQDGEGIEIWVRNDVSR